MYSELEESSVCAIFAHTADDGKTYNVKFFALQAVWKRLRSFCRVGGTGKGRSGWRMMRKLFDLCVL